MNRKMNSYTHAYNFICQYKNQSKKNSAFIINSLTYKGVMYEKS